MTSYPLEFPLQVQQCKCACGTRISLDEQLLNEREQWKLKYYALQKQSAREIGLLKQKIYQECSSLMHSEFLSKQRNHTAIINAKNTQIQQLMARVMKMETACKISEKQNELLSKTLEQEEKRFNQKLEEMLEIKNQNLKKMNDLQKANLKETELLKAKITENYQNKIEKYQKQNEHLKHKILEFQKKYFALIPEVEKLKNTLGKKNEELEGLQQQRERSKQIHIKEVSQLKEKLEELSNLHTPCVGKIAELTQKIASLQNQVAKTKIVKKQIKVEPVYVDRPVQVEKVVQKLIQVERIVKEYIEPTEEYQNLEENNKNLKLQLQKVVQELQIFQARYDTTLNQHEQTICQYEQNIKKYKNEREGIVKRLQEQDQELQKIYHLVEIQAQKVCMCSNQPERIVVQIGKDGVINKRIEKIKFDEKIKATVTKLTGNVKEFQSAERTEQPIKTMISGYRGTRANTTQAASKRK